MMRLIETYCYNCKSKEYKIYDSENGFNLVKCKKCGLLYVNPRPSDDDISVAVRTGIHQGDTEFNITNSFNEKVIPRYLNILSNFYRLDELISKTWLDIGCGNGEFLVALNTFSSNKITLKGSEPNIFKIQNARNHHLDVDFLDLESHEKQYDFVSMLNVFSHLANPYMFLENLKNLIKQDGELFIETGHSSHLLPRFHSKPYFLPDHLSFGNKKILVNILEKSGYQILKVKIYRGIYYPDYKFINFIKELAKLILGRKNLFHSYFPVYEHGDMFIRAKKKQI
jgi:2-polyprenyl-3-methyl-5-hydroxy-6-metoxy-1,4-benzoquinol methylase